jgi:hypothetical protein
MPKFFLIKAHKISPLFHFRPYLLQTGFGAHPLRTVGGGGGVSYKLKQPESEANHSLASSADIKNASALVFMAWRLNATANFTLLKVSTIFG